MKLPPPADQFFYPAHDPSWQVQVALAHPWQGHATNLRTGEQLPWIELKERLYGQSWCELATELIQAATAPPGACRHLYVYPPEMIAAGFQDENAFRDSKARCIRCGKRLELSL